MLYLKELSFEEVAKKYEPIIKKQLLSLNIYKNHDDFYQIGLIALWEAYSRFDYSKGKFTTYAITYVRGRMLSYLQKEKKYFEHNEYALMEGVFMEQPEENMMYLEEDIIQLYVETLSPKEKLWVREAIFLGKKVREIATEQRVSINTVKSWRKQAKRKLKQTALSLQEDE